jgi:hypothetical protein
LDQEGLGVVDFWAVPLFSYTFPVRSSISRSADLLVGTLEEFFTLLT